MRKVASKWGRSLGLCLGLGCWVAPSLAVDGVQVITTTYTVHADDARGAELRPRYDAAIELLQAGKLDEADAQLRELIAAYDALRDPAQANYAFQTQVDLAEFTQQTQQAFVWLDWRYAMALKARAFIASEHGLYEDALMQLRAIEVVAPINAEALAESGFVLGRLHRPDEALASYRKALEVCRKFASQQPRQGMVLRGIGYMLVELGRLDEAEQAYKESLAVEPGNGLAAKELTYIAQVRARSAKASP